MGDKSKPTIFLLQSVRILLSAVLLTASFLFIELRVFDPLMLSVMMLVVFSFLWFFEFYFSCHRFFCLPPAYYVLTMFFYVFLSGVVYFLFQLEGATQFTVSDYYILRGIWYTQLSIQVLWIAFYLFPDRPILEPLGLRANYVPMGVVYVFLLAFVCSFLISIATGNFGYTAGTENIGASNLLRYGLSCGPIAIVLLTIFHSNSYSQRQFLYGVIIANMLVGALFGSKSSMVTPLFVFILTSYMCGGVINWRLLFAVVGAIALAYVIIEPFRIFYEVTGGDTLTLSGLLQIFITAQEVTDGVEFNYLQSFLTRINYATAVGKAIEYADVNNYYRSSEWLHVLLSPAYGFIPRFLWESKPLADFGIWASVNIFDLPDTTHTGILPAAYSYLVARGPAIILFFSLYGVLQRLVFNMFYISRSLLPVYIYFYYFVVYPSYPVWTSVSSFIQSLIMLGAVFFVVAVGRLLLSPYHRSRLS